MEVQLSLIYIYIYSINFLSILAYFLLRPMNYIQELKGISYSHYILTLLLFINLFSLAGLPPFNGFYIKLALLETLAINGSSIITNFYLNFYLATIVVFSLLNTINYLKLIEISSLPNNRSALTQNLPIINTFIPYFIAYSTLFNFFGFAYFFDSNLFVATSGVA